MIGILDTVWGVAILLMLFGATIFVHEFGHYISARLLGLVVDVFSIGFGPALWQFKRNGVTYKIACIPFGGYVALPQLDPAGMRRVQGGEGDEPARDLPRVAPWKKIVVSASGAVGNVLLAVVLAWVVFWAGIPGGPAERSAVVGYVEPGTPAHAAGLRASDEVLAVNAAEVDSWSGVRLEAALNDAVELRVRKPDGAEAILSIPTGEGMFGERALEGVMPVDICEVLSVGAGSSAEAAGIQAGDIVIAFAGKPMHSRAQLIEAVQARADEAVPIRVLRGKGETAREVDLTVTPAHDPAVNRARIGITFNIMAVDHDTLMHPRPWDQIKDHSKAIGRFLGALVTPSQSRAASKAVGGPVAIFVSYWTIVRTSIMLAIWFTGFLNINLAILNMLPLPVLDGGHIMFSLWEAVVGRPPRPSVVDALVNAFAVLLIGLMLFLGIRDLDRFTTLGRRVRGLFTRDAAVTNATESAEGSLPQTAPGE